MFRLDAGLRVYLHRDAVDGRKNINGLAALVEQALGLDPFAAVVYVFSNRRRDRIKLLLWDRTGFWLLLKRLEADRFVWPREAAVALNETLDANALNLKLPGRARQRGLSTYCETDFSLCSADRPDDQGDRQMANMEKGCM
ncbi:MAG: IS66 family insertion sequence element accessory protein TnpB [Betaproteobacteria bacterium]|nr:IS66 family insertion sequence element accessory protein TnpB [Betaproteobacteria bacterium]